MPPLSATLVEDPAEPHAAVLPHKSKWQEFLLSLLPAKVLRVS